MLTDYLAETKQLVLAEIDALLTSSTNEPELYRLMMDYPLRGGKGLRPALAVAMCRGLGGSLDAILPTAAILELYHNAFLIHDDIEDESLARRGEPTLHLDHGVPIAVNVGDAMLCLSLKPLLDNTARLGLGPALDILEVVAAMTRRSVEGQATELRWVRDNTWQLDDDDYIDMVIAKTGWYSFIAPLQIGALAAGADPEQVQVLAAFGRNLSVAFQITDDLLNLDATADDYGKEIAGDLWEGKRTLPLLHAVHGADPADRDRALAVLDRPRPGGVIDEVRDCVDRMLETAELQSDAGATLLAILEEQPRAKSASDVVFLLQLIEASGSIEHATRVADAHASQALELLDGFDWLPASRHREMLEALVHYVQERRS